MPPRGAKTSADLRAASRAAGRCPRLRPARAVASLPGGGSPRLSAQSEASSPVSFRHSRSVTASVPSPGRRVAFVLKESALSTRPVSLGFRSRRLKNLGQASPSFGVPLFLAFRKATPNPVGYASLDFLKVPRIPLPDARALSSRSSGAGLYPGSSTGPHELAITLRRGLDSGRNRPHAPVAGSPFCDDASARPVPLREGAPSPREFLEQRSRTPPVAVLVVELLDPRQHPSEPHRVGVEHGTAPVCGEAVAV